MGWHGVPNVTPEQQGPSFLLPLGCFLRFSYYCIIVVAKEKSREIMDELNLGLCDILGNSIFSCTHIIHLIVT